LSDPYVPRLVVSDPGFVSRKFIVKALQDTAHLRVAASAAWRQ